MSHRRPYQAPYGGRSRATEPEDDDAPPPDPDDFDPPEEHASDSDSDGPADYEGTARYHYPY